MHNRLTHSEKVAQVARSIAESLIRKEQQGGLIQYLGGIDADVVEAASLAHDLGHPPFGHIGELTLDQVSRDPGVLGLSDGFEGNAQTFRIVLLCETRNPSYDGLDLTCATLTAIAKYPWLRTPTLNEKDHKIHLQSNSRYRRRWRKFSVYKPEERAFETAREFLTNSGIGKGFPDETQSLEASIMDAADDITYAIHDFEDFYIAGILDVNAVLEELNDPGDLLNDLQKRLELDYPGYYDSGLFDAAGRSLEQKIRLGFSTRRSRRNVDLDDRIGRAKEAGSDLIGHYIANTLITETPAWGNSDDGWGPFVTLRREEWHQIQILKELTRSHVIQRPDIALLQRGQQKILADLVRYLHDWKESRDDFKRLPFHLKQEIEIARGQNWGHAEGEVNLARGYYSIDSTERPFAFRGEENRCILDYLCTLTDGQTYALYNKLVGAKAASTMDFFL